MEKIRNHTPFDARFAEKKGVKHAPKVPKTVPDDVANLVALAEAYITAPRLDNVKSRIGEVSFPKDLGRVSGLLAKQEQKTLNGLLSKRAIDFIKVIIGMP